MNFKNFKETEYLHKLKKPGGKSTGYLYTNIHILGKIIKRMSAGFSPIIVIVGGQRIGKSFVAIWLCNIISEFFHNKPYDINHNTFYDPVESIKRIGDIYREPILIDEAGTYLNKTEWYNRVVRAMDKIIQTQGLKCNCYVFVSPFGSDIAKTFRKHFDYMLFVRLKGVIVVRAIPKRYDAFDDKPIKPFRLEQIKMNKKAVPPEIWREYEQFSFERKEAIREEFYIKAKKTDKDLFGRRRFE